MEKRTTNRFQSPLMLFYDVRLLKTVLRALRVDSVKNVLEVGCGCGTDAIHVLDCSLHVVGVDVSINSRALKEGMTLLSDSKKARLSFLLSDAEYLPFQDNQFDIVLCKDLLHHVPTPETTLREMKRVARVGGNIVAIEANGFNPQMTVIGILHFSVDKGVFKNTDSRLAALFSKEAISDVSVGKTEYLPRAFLFDYRSPFSRLNSDLVIMCLSRMEDGLDKLSVARKFANYIIVHGIKKN